MCEVVVEKSGETPLVAKVDQEVKPDGVQFQILISLEWFIYSINRTASKPEV
jgi:hypothetical protein